MTTSDQRELRHFKAGNWAGSNNAHKNRSKTMEELEEAVVLKRSRASSLSEVRSLQCWGMRIERVSWMCVQIIHYCSDSQ